MSIIKTLSHPRDCPGLQKQPRTFNQRPVHLIISMKKWIRTSRLSIKNSLLPSGAAKRWGDAASDPPCEGWVLDGPASGKRASRVSAYKYCNPRSHAVPHHTDTHRNSRASTSTHAVPQHTHIRQHTCSPATHPHMHRKIQGYLTHKKTHPPRTLP